MDTQRFLNIGCEALPDDDPTFVRLHSAGNFFPDYDKLCRTNLPEIQSSNVCNQAVKRRPLRLKDGYEESDAL